MTGNPCTHTRPDYYTGRCKECGERIESPSQQLLDYAASIGGRVVTMTKTYRITADGRLEP